MKEEFGTQLENGSLRFVRDLPGPIERVWAYLVDPDKRALWFCGGTMVVKPGDAFTMTFDHETLSHEKNPERYADMKGGIDLPARLVAMEAPRLLIFEGVSGEDETRIELKERGGRVRLTLIQSPPAEFDQLVSTGAGWHAHLGLLVDHLCGDAPRGFWTEHEEAEPCYRDALKPAE